MLVGVSFTWGGGCFCLFTRDGGWGGVCVGRDVCMQQQMWVEVVLEGMFACVCVCVCFGEGISCRGYLF